MAADVVVGTVALFVAALFAAQRHYMTPFGGLFPDFVMAGLATFGGLLLGRTVHAALRDRRAPRPAGPGRTHPGDEAEPPLRVALVAVFLAAWLWVLWALGFVVGGTLGFAGMAAWLAPEGKRSRHLWIRGLVAGASWTMILYLVFARMLSVPLPVGWWAGRF